jgi:ribosomal protein L11 methyltransferase
LIRLAVRCPADRAELVLAALVELAPAGVEQVDRGETTEFAIYGAPGELPALGDAEAEVGGVRVVVRATEVGDDWAERWKEFHRPVEIAGRVRVRPPWRERSDGFEDIVIDPGRAFGTAAHPTTRMCCELLIEAAGRGGASGPLVDLGAGSGVLAILASRLGWGPVVAVDHETAAIEAVQANAEANAVEVAARRIDLRREPPPAAPTVVANLTADLLIVLADGYAEGGDPPDHLVCSGIREDQAARVGRALARAGLTVRQRLVEAGWVALTANRIEPC